MSVVEDGFRLAGAPSESSLTSKARIDALFEDTRSVCSSMLGGWYAEVNLPAMTFDNLDEIGAEEQKRVNSAVQARIEAMFASVEAETGIPGECAAAILPVRYLGAAPVGGRVASVRGLQEPLRDLLGRLEKSLPAELEVSRRGLTFRTSESVEKTNPFRRIAVWSALGLRSKRLGSGELQFAFVPLVGDDATPSSCGDDKHADLYRTMKSLKRGARSCPPIFAVVMRRPGAVRLLECHAFVCRVEEDAVAAAATLYRALLADLDANRQRPRQTNGVGRVSLASAASLSSSIVRDALPTGRSRLGPPPPRPTAPHPVRPPRVKKNSLFKDEGSSSGLENLVERSGKTVEVKAEDILEGRSRRSSVALSVALPLSLTVDNNSVSQKVLQENNKNNSMYGKSVISARNQNQYEIFQRIDSNRNDIKDNFRTRGHSGSTYVGVETKIPGPRNTGKLDDGKLQVEKDDRSNGGIRRPTSSIGEERVNILNQNQENIQPTKKQGYQSRASSVTSERSNSNGIYNQISGSYNIYDQSEASKRSKDQRQVYEEHFRDVDKISTLNQDEDEEYIEKGKSWYPRNSAVYKGRNSQEAKGAKVTERQSSASNVSLTKPASKNTLTSKVTEYSQPKPRRSSRAGSEPPRIGRVENDLVFSSAAQQENRLKKAQSDLDLDGGDLLTRVELPRRGSFLNSSSTRKPEKFQGRTPLGFTELFDEFRNQEGLTSVDDILAAIIDPEGMSFNDLKPLYKEFLLKLATTLTRDELYERSASIMRRRRRPQRGRASRRPCLLGRAIKRSVSRLKGGPTEFTSVIFPARKLNDSLGSSSSYDVRNTRNRVLTSKLNRKRSSRCRPKAAIGQTTSEDSDTCRRFGRVVAANRSSSGYVSCSECSYDSESCTCVSADKCYCSLSRRVSAPEIPVATVMCSCDTDSCSESNKCYCARKLPVRQPTILEQLRQHGIVPSESTLSRAGSPQVVRTVRTNKSYSSSRSLEFHKVRPRANSSDNLALDYDLFSPGKNPRSISANSDKVLVVGARDPQGRLIYVGGTGRGKRAAASETGRSRAHHEALSIKKSAEIAAVFGSSAKVGRRASNASSLKSSASMEAGLGYLP
ncbi:uncharacterized protein LOC124174752 [Neodiprion fabricii]|uniref:uncharacterized protein LOC124174752 n=1 Tax=Neodiprion fabricii TaxID=2872261 RepID=UPI001ED93653|nr:uncharacterized protein LOC124174752 [Neodiprion fabricii]